MTVALHSRSLTLSSCVLGICLTIAFGEARCEQVQNTFPATAPMGLHAFKLDDLGELASIAADVKVSLNNDGAVAWWRKNEDGLTRATLSLNNHVTVMKDVFGYPNSIAHAINRKGNIAGWMNTTNNLVDSLSTTRGFVLTQGLIKLVPSLGGRDSKVLGLNDKGIAVGEASLADGTSHAFVFSGSKIFDLGTLPSGTSSTAYAMNGAGLIVGAADVEGKFNHAVSWANRSIVDLGTLPNGVTSSARSVNDLGQVVGFGDTPDGVHAFLYSQGTMRDLGTLGNDPSEASSINIKGDIVGASNVNGSKRHAFLWTNNQMFDLNEVIPAGSEWLLLNAFSINDRGQIVCAGRHKGGSPRLVLLTPK